MIVTFYSFKGGVGRSFSLVETALQLAGRGASVVVWDLDLEAPGLQKLPNLQILEDGLTTGTLDLLLEFQGNDYTFPASESLRHAVVPFLHLPENPTRSGGRLSFLLPARLDEDYPRKFGQVDWETQLSPDGAGAAFFHRVAALLHEQFDYLLIDSRTGFTQLSAVCSLQLPDLVILVFNYNEQNLAGIARVHQVITRTPARMSDEIPALLLANMVPKEPSALKKKEEDLRKLGLLTPLLNIPLRSELLWTDLLPSFDPDPDRDALEARSKYGLLADEIEARRRDLEGDREKADQEKLARAVAKGDRSEISRLRRQGIYEKARDFEEKVAEVFSLHDYHVKLHHRSGDLDFGLRLEIPRGLLQAVALVECKTGSGSITTQEVQETARRVEAARDIDKLPYQAMLIASSEPLPAVREVASAERVHVQSYKQLLLSLIEPAALLDHAIRGLQGTALERLWVDLDVLMEDRQSGESFEPRELTPEVSQWLRQPRAPLFVLLGEFGGGKTSFCRRLACQLALRAREEWEGGKLEGRIPIYVDLRDPSAAGTIENLLLQQIQRISPKAVHPQAPMLLNREGRFLLLLDGFDEITGHTGPGQSLELLRQLLRAAEPQAKLLITCRPHFFRDRPAESARSEESAGRPSTRLYEEVRDRHRAAIGYVLDFQRGKMQEYLQKAVPPPASWLQVEQNIRETPGLSELASRPFLLNLIVETLPELSHEGRSVNLARLYEVYCQSWFDQADFRLTLDRAWRTTLVEQLARLVWDAPQGRIHAEVLTEKALELFRDRGIPLKDQERIDSEIRTAPFLRRDPLGYYSFSHPTFLEFFVARSLREGIVLDDPRCLDLRRISRQVGAFLEDWPEAGQIPRLVSGILSRPCQSPRSENGLLLLYFHARAMVGPLVGPSADDTKIETVRSHFTRLRPEEIFLEGADLEGAALPGIDLQGAHLEKARLARADLRHTSLAGAFLSQAVLRFADCRDVCADGADFTEADLDHLDGRGASFERARFQKARLAFARLARAKLRGAIVDGAELKGVGALGAEMTAQEALRAEELGASVKPSLTIRPQFGPSTPVTDLAWSSDSRCMAVLVDRKTVVVWDAESADRLLTFERDDEEFRALAWGPRDLDLALASSRGRLLRWDPSAEKLAVLAEVDNSVACLAWSPKGGRYLAMAHQAQIQILDLEDGGGVHRLGEHTDAVTTLAWKPDGTALASASLDRTVRFWDLQGRELRPLALENYPVPVALRWSPDGRTLTVVFPGGRAAAALEAGTLDFELMIDLRLIGAVLPFLGAGPAADYQPSRMVWSPKDDLIAVAYRGAPAEIRKSTDAVTVCRLEGTTSLPVSFVSWSPASRYLAAGFTKGGIHVWDLLAGSSTHLVEAKPETPLAVGWEDQDRSLLAIRENLSLFTLDIGSGITSELETAMSNRTALAAAVSRDGRTVAAALDHYDSIVVRKGDGQWSRVPTEGTEVYAVGLSPDGSHLAAACEDRVRIWEQDTGRSLNLEGQDGHNPVCLAWSSDGQRLATGAVDGTIRVWDVQSGRPLRALSGHRESAVALAWSDSGRLASISKGQILRVWDVEEGSSIQDLHLGGIGTALEWPVPSRLLVVMGDRIEVWSVAPGRSQRVARLFALPGGPLAITQEGYVNGSKEALRAIRFGDDWALYDLDDVPERLSPEKVAAALLPAVSGPT